MFGFLKPKMPAKEFCEKIMLSKERLDEFNTKAEQVFNYLKERGEEPEEESFICTIFGVYLEVIGLTAQYIDGPITSLSPNAMLRRKLSIQCTISKHEYIESMQNSESKKIIEAAQTYSNFHLPSLRDKAPSLACAIILVEQLGLKHEESKEFLIKEARSIFEQYMRSMQNIGRDFKFT